MPGNACADDLCFLNARGKIAENVVYVDLMTESEYTEYLNRFSNNFLDMLKSADETFSAVTLLLQEQEGSLRCVRQYGSVEGIDFSTMQYSDELVQEKTQTLARGTGSQVISLTVAATIREQDTIAVKLFLNREICLLFEREGIELL